MNNEQIAAVEAAKRGLPLGLVEIRAGEEGARLGKFFRNHDPVGWNCEWRVDKFQGIDLKDPYFYDLWSKGKLRPDDYCGGMKNLLMTVGATDLLNGLVTAGLATPFNSSNAQISVGDSSTAASAGQTDIQAAQGTKLNAADPGSASNATPIVVAATYSPTPTVGMDVVGAGFSGAGGAAANAMFELSVASGSSITLLNSAGTGSITVTGATIKPINAYRQLVNGAPSVSTNTVQFVSVYGANNGNFAWQEFAIGTGGSATNKQAAPPTHLLNRAVASNGTKVQGASWTFTVTVTLS